MTTRFSEAIQKLYNAFHNKTLQPECCKQCAVGNILDNTDNWKHFSDSHGSTELNYIGNVNQLVGKKFNGYSPLELLEIEATFLKACGFSLPLHHSKKISKELNDDILFKGLSAVVTLLCKLDGTKDVLDCSSIFNYNKKKEKTLVTA
ncbi:Na(+)-translocating NADH-quinone reductase subunit F [Patiriisocius hiemis]|uniref:Na(+)-translocating NADH-quinone reductase subunit F n=1 Tax=Patiriisocius hiemis TaxID=3075604 RepID=A0ABU2YEA0_9FLAO|nr:Na(+)-translocating NADH-quinone reductase subunit F [Constantimarinum sp. W242]MDT0556523.1 Na(+)-translocating NADH-quinone reductase subunit F [Constantimarinum sp. W242]